MVTVLLGCPLGEPSASTALTTSMPDSTRPKTVWRPLSQLVCTVVMKNCDNISCQSKREKVFLAFAFVCCHLRSVGVGAGIGHGQQTRAGVVQLKVLIVELGAIDGLATGTGAMSEIACARHEIVR